MTKLYFDGGCRPNPGQMETAVVTLGKLYYRPNVGRGSSELAEWHALLDAVEVARSLGLRDLILLGDALAVIRQSGIRAPRGSDDSHACREAFIARSQDFDRVRVRHIKRTQNLAGIALGQLRQNARVGTEAAQ